MPKYTDKHNPFKTANPDLEERQKESTQVKARYSDRKPVIIYTDDSKFLPLEKYKYLVPEDSTLAQFMAVIRKKVKIGAEQSIWLYVKDGVMPPTSTTITSLYEEHADEDGFLYIKFVGENVFG